MTTIALGWSAVMAFDRCTSHSSDCFAKCRAGVQALQSPRIAVRISTPDRTLPITTMVAAVARAAR
jgi:hypothetical protein